MTAPILSTNISSDDTAISQSSNAPENSARGNIKVAVRFRPLIEDPEQYDRIRKKNAEKTAWNIEKVGAMHLLTQKGYGPKVEGRTSFQFDQVFGKDSQTPLVYKSIARPMVNATMNGKHATIFAYGQTGSGKTFTMQGEGKIGSGKAGIIQLVTSDIFRYTGKGEALKRDFKVKVSYFEIYNEQIRDLLASDPENASTDTSSTTTTSGRGVTIRTNASGEIIVNVEQKRVHNVDEALALLVQGNMHRTVGATGMNEQSSRSHAIFRLTIESRLKTNHQPIENQDNEIVRVSDFNLVDLAGSESLKLTKATGNRQREGATINKSLLALTSVIQSLSQPLKKRPQYINYRDSKLTRILQPHLSGNAEMAILCCASPSSTFVEETRSTLKFASRAKLVQVEPRVNEVMDDGAMIRKLQKEVSELRRQLASMEIELEKSRENIYIESTQVNRKDHTVISHESNDIEIHGSMTELSASASGFQLDAADPDIARKAIQRFSRGRLDSFDPEEFLDSSENSTTDTSDDDITLEGKRDSCLLKTPYGVVPVTVESFDTPPSVDAQSSSGKQGGRSNASLIIRSQVSSPDTIRGSNGENRGGGPVFRSRDTMNVSPNGRLQNSLSWDAMDGNDYSLVENGATRVQALKSLLMKKSPIPDEVTIIDTLVVPGNKMCLTDRLEDAESRNVFLGEKLKLLEDANEAGARDLERARHYIHDLVRRNTEMQAQMKERQREMIKEDYERGEVIVEQYWILRASLYFSVFFFLSGSHEYFLATVFFVWLTLEMSVTA